jgi:F0F1-type ATP synthase assembly protein I
MPEAVSGLAAGVAAVGIVYGWLLDHMQLRKR